MASSRVLSRSEPQAAVDELAIVHNQLGEIFRNASDVDRALPHYRDAIRYREQQGNVYGASQTRFNVALALAQSGRPADALEYARSALRGFESYGESAAEMIQRTRQVIGMIEGRLGGGVGSVENPPIPPNPPEAAHRTRNH